MMMMMMMMMMMTTMTKQYFSAGNQTGERVKSPTDVNAWRCTRALFSTSAHRGAQVVIVDDSIGRVSSVAWLQRTSVHSEQRFLAIS